MTTATATRDASYHQLTDLGEKQAAVYRVIAERGPINNRAIAESLGWDVNRVTPRVFELRERGLVTEAGTTWDSETGRNVTLWGIIPQMRDESSNMPPDALRRSLAAESIETGHLPIPTFDTPILASNLPLGQRLLQADKAARDAGLSGYWIELYRLVAIATTPQELAYAAKVLAGYKVAKYPEYQIIKALGEQKKKELSR